MLVGFECGSQSLRVVDWNEVKIGPDNRTDGWDVRRNDGQPTGQRIQQRSWLSVMA